MLGPNDSLLMIWRSQPANRHLTDDSLSQAIAAAYIYVDSHAARVMTKGARDLAASYRVRCKLGATEERELLRDVLNLLMGVYG